MASGTTRRQAKTDGASHAVHLPCRFLPQSIYLTATWTTLHSRRLLFHRLTTATNEKVVLGRPARIAVRGT
jgi:hypothetical protein